MSGQDDAEVDPLDPLLVGEMEESGLVAALVSLILVSVVISIFMALLTMKSFRSLTILMKTPLSLVVLTTVLTVPLTMVLTVVLTVVFLVRKFAGSPSRVLN